jgi:hypothetical protein
VLIVVCSAVTVVRAARTRFRSHIRPQPQNGHLFKEQPAPTTRRALTRPTPPLGTGTSIAARDLPRNARIAGAAEAAGRSKVGEFAASGLLFKVWGAGVYQAGAMKGGGWLCDGAAVGSVTAWAHLKREIWGVAKIPCKVSKQGARLALMPPGLRPLLSTPSPPRPRGPSFACLPISLASLRRHSDITPTSL